MKLGFTGSRTEPTDEQKLWFKDFLASHDVAEFHHGCCMGSDAAAHHIAIAAMVPVVIHPPTNTSWMDLSCYKMPDNKTPLTTLKAKKYLDRNKDIVDACDLLIAFPDGYVEKLRSGTWSTIRYANRVTCNHIIVYPDSTIEEHSWEDIDQL